MAYGFKISLPNKAADSADPQDFSVHSDYPSPLIEETLIGTETYTWSSDLTASETRTIFTLAHGYSFIPKAMCMVSNGVIFDGTEFSIPAPFVPSSGSWGFEAYTDATNFKIILQNYTAGGVAHDDVTYTFKYYIITDDAI